MRQVSIRQKASLVILSITVVALFMVAIGWQSMRISEASLSEFEAQTLPEISTALTLAESVAQLAAAAPYTAGSARPFQLQTESERLNRRITDLRSVADNLKDTAFRAQIEERLESLETTLDELVELVHEELYIREDSLAQQFAIRQILPTTSQQKTLQEYQVLAWLLRLIEKPGQVAQQIVQELNILDASPEVKRIAESLLKAQQRLNDIQDRKSYLLISLRAKSEQLSAQVSEFVGALQKQVSRQRLEVGQVVANGQLWLMGISLFLVVGLSLLYRSSRRMTRDLESVTQDMEELSLGQVDLRNPQVKRNDEIGTLANAFEVFRRDAIRRLEVSAELSEQKRLLETIFDNMNDGLSVFSEKGLLIAWNKGYEALFDIQSDQLYHGMPLAEVQKLITQSSHKNLNMENQLVHMDEVNASRHHRSQSFERHFDSGKIIEFRSKPMPDGGFVTLYTDLTERKSVESQLRQAQKMEVLGQLTGGVAHDFNNLLAAIMGNLQMLSDSEPKTDDQARYVERALAVAEKSSSLVHRLLAFSRRQQLFPEPTHVDDLIEGMLDLVEYSVGNHIRVEVDLNCPKQYCLIDPSQLENALLNLSLNSAAAMARGGTLSFSTKATTLPDSDVAGVRIKVEDTGSGISEEVLGRIFEPFFTTKPVGKGSGLGLSMIYGFVKQSGGEIRVTSEEGQWTKVCLFLPLMATQDAAGKPSKLESLPVVEVPQDAVIWLVEDDPEVRRVMREQLQKLGCMVQDFERAEDVLDALNRSFHPDLIMSDVNLAGEVHGVTLAHTLKQNSAWVGQVLLMSGLPIQELRESYGLEQDDLILSKPFTINELQRVFRFKM
ncbi:PAS-domain containing protein [Marinomonas fungiae]|uniref:histidine kinase n=1 Tax=Marinomonas fungiae TaxID=1137284 RepID=A0A0K6ITK1_9GAMM|nr:PAS-domain containing protein [Marinomonas fungiae]CUB06433.1 His Kinase A (phospho-acceptor) domain/Response regulator receiver domain/HAMP domain/Histidine kinase-, DNA gyrase B-, and HSP90-like ATPase/PAS fold [Marinomonas fungiae]